MERGDIIPSDVPSAFDVLRSLTSLERQAIVRPNDPPPGLAGFLFDVVGEETFELQSDITDHYVENNTAINDQIALRPEVITLQGLVAELAGVPPVSGVAKETTEDTLPTNPFFLPELTPGARQTLSELLGTNIDTLASTVSANSLYDYYARRFQSNQTKQARAHAYFYQLWKGRVLMTVETPWGFMTNMVIQTMRAVQNEDSRYQSEFRLTLKKFRFAEEIVVSDGQLAGRNVPQLSPQTANSNAGTKDQTATEKSSILYKMFNPGK